MFSRRDIIEISAPAKINLSLEVLGHRKDGYHEIRSALVPISLCDHLTLTRTDGEVKRVIQDDGLAETQSLREEPQENGLSIRAANALREATGYRGGVHISIQKNIPIGGGLGGGSSDAAATLVGLNVLWDCGLERDELMAVGSKLGCDVPALIHGGAVTARGTGTQITPIPQHSLNGDAHWWLVIVNPKILVSTRDIYTRHGGSLTNADQTYKNILFSLQSGDLELASRSLFNGLQATVVAKYPLIGMVMDELRQAGALSALVSGSGASVFGFATSEALARQVETDIKIRLGEAIWACVARTLPDGVMVAQGPLTA